MYACMSGEVAGWSGVGARVSVTFPFVWMGGAKEINRGGLAAAALPTPRNLTRWRRVVVKLGPRYDMGRLLPNEKEWAFVTSGKDFAVWERKG